MKRRLQFSIATLFVLVAICALVTQLYAMRSRLVMAQDEFGAAKAGLMAGTADDKQVYAASVKLLRAEQAMPFSNRRAACARYLELMESREKYWRTLPLISTVGGDPADFRRECNEEAHKIHVWVEEARHWLDDAS